MTILEKIGLNEALLQLAEEASELSQAALKYRRAKTEINPTPVSQDDALSHLLEEIADVRVCCDVLLDGATESWNEIGRLTRMKHKRWQERLGIEGE